MAVAVALILAVPILLPWAAQQAVVAWLHGQGIPQASLNDIDINPFTGKITLTGLHAGEGLRWGRLELRIDWLPLLNRTLHIRALHFSDAAIHLKTDTEVNTLRIGDLILPHTPPSGQSASGSPEAFSWQIALERARFENIHLEMAEGQDHFQARLVLLDLLGRAHATAHTRTVQSTLNLDQVALNTAEQQLTLDELYWHGHITLPPLQSLEQLSVADGMLLLEALTLNHRDGASASLQMLRLEQIALPDMQHLQIGRGTVSAMATRHAVADLTLAGAAADSIDIALNDKNELAQLSMAQITIHALQAGHDALHILGIGSGSARELRMDHQLLPALSRLELTDITLPASSSHALGKIGHLDIRQAALASENSLVIDHIGAAGLDLSLRVQKEGIAVIAPLQEHLARTSSAGAKKPPQSGGAESFTAAIRTIELAPGSTMALLDTTISPHFRIKLESRHLSVESLDSSGKARGAFKAAFRMNRDGALDATGQFRLRPGDPQLDMRLTMARLDMTDLSGYMEQAFGHKVQTGQLDLKSSVTIADAQIKAQNSLDIRRLSVRRGERQGSAEQNLGMPLDTALDMLRDDRGDIELEVPVSGRLDDPDIDISDAINQAIASTMGSAALSYAALLLQPYGSILPALSYASDFIKAASKPRLTPILFRRQSHRMSDEAAAYADKLIKLLEKRPLRLQLCGIALRNEADALQAGESPMNDEMLLQLAAERAHQVKAKFTSHGIAPERLFNCRPSIDEKSVESGRVELLLD